VAGTTASVGKIDRLTVARAEAPPDDLAV